MRRFGHFIFVRHRQNWTQLIRFGLVGGSGALVNMVVVIVLKRVGANYRDVFFDLPLTSFNVRWYHVYVTIAFLVANAWNFLINRRWTFRTTQHSSWHTEYPPFLAVGAVGQLIGLALITALIHSGSPISLPDSFFNDSNGLRTKLYWAQLISIIVVTPVTFVVNKLWTFSSVRRGRPTHLVPIDGESSALDQADAPGVVDPAEPEPQPAASGPMPPDSRAAS